MGILGKMIETAKVTDEVASNGLRKFGYQSYSKAKKASETVADEITPAAVKKAKTASKIVSETVAPAAIKSALEVYERFKSDYDPETAKAFKTAYDKFAKANPGEAGSTIIGGGVGAGIGYAIGGSIGVVGFFGGIGIPWLVVLVVSMAFAGNRIGLGLDKKQIEQKSREQEDRYRSLIDSYEKAMAANKKPEGVNIVQISSPEDHNKLLKNAMRNSEHTVILLCGWVTTYVIDTEFKTLLGKALKRGVNVLIGYGYTASGEAKPANPHQKEAEAYLERLREWCAENDTKGILVVKKFPNHAKVLIRDDKYAVMGSFNWLSNAGRSQNSERSWVVKDRDFVLQETEIIINQLASFMDKRDFLKRFFPWSKH